MDAKIQYFIGGCLISFLSFSALFLIRYSNESYFFNAEAHFIDVSSGAVGCFAVALIEELLFRYLFLKSWIKDKTKTFSISVVYLGVVSSIIFGFLHLNLEHFPLMQINIVFSGLTLFLATYLFRDIWLAVGMHFSWNLVQGVVFPFEGSGNSLKSILVFDKPVSVYPEADPLMIVTTLVELLLILLLYRLKQKKGFSDV